MKKFLSKLFKRKSTKKNEFDDLQSEIDADSSDVFTIDDDETHIIHHSSEDETELLEDFEIPGVPPSIKTSFMTRLLNQLKNLKNKKISTSQFKSIDLSKLNSNSFIQKIKKIKWEGYIDEIFATENRPKFHKIFKGSIIIFSSITLGNIIGAFIHYTPEAPINSMVSMNSASGLDQKQIQQVSNTNPFKAKVEVIRPKTDKPKVVIDENKICHQSNEKTSLQIKFESAIVLQDSVKSIAAVSVKSGKELLRIRQGDKIQNMAKVGLITPEKIIFNNLQTGKCEYISSSQKDMFKKSRSAGEIGDIISKSEGNKILNNLKKQGIRSEGNKLIIPSSLKRTAFSNMQEILTQARAIPIPKADGTMEFKIVDVVPDGVFAQLNIQDDDKITHIDGRPIKNMNEIMTLFGQFADLQQLQLTIERDGNSSQLEYVFE